MTAAERDELIADLDRARRWQRQLLVQEGEVAAAVAEFRAQRRERMHPRPDTFGVVALHRQVAAALVTSNAEVAALEAVLSTTNAAPTAEEATS